MPDKVTFQCEHCGGTFPQDPTQSESDRLMEYQDLWTEEQRTSPEMPVRICDDCFSMLLQKAKRLGLCQTK